MHINKMLVKYTQLFSFSIHYVYAFLFSILGSILIFTLYDLLTPITPKIAVVNMSAIVRDFVNQESKHTQSKDILAKEVKQFALTLENTLKVFARENHLLLMPSQAVIAGYDDYTPVIKHQMQAKMINKHFPRKEKNDE